MSVYVNAKVLASFYLGYDDEAEVGEMLTGAAARKVWPLPITTLVRLELRNALELMVFATRQGGRWRVTAEGAAAAWAHFQDDLARGDFLHLTALSLEDIASEFENLSARHSARHGFRTYDLLHVTSALHLGCDTFWSFDKKALKLARLEGLKTD